MKPEKTSEYSVTVTHKGEEVTVKGVAYDLPIRRTDEVEIYSIIEFVVKGIVLRTINFSVELSSADLKLEVEDHAKNIDKYLK